MVPTTTVAGDQTSVDSQSNREYPVFSKTDLLPEEIRTPFVMTGVKPVAPPPDLIIAVDGSKWAVIRALRDVLVRSAWNFLCG